MAKRRSLKENVTSIDPKTPTKQSKTSNYQEKLDKNFEALLADTKYDPSEKKQTRSAREERKAASPSLCPAPFAGIPTSCMRSTR